MISKSFLDDTAHPAGPFVCIRCGTDFLNRDTLAMHVMDMVHDGMCRISPANQHKMNGTDLSCAALDCTVKTTKPYAFTNLLEQVAKTSGDEQPAMSGLSSTVTSVCAQSLFQSLAPRSSWLQFQQALASSQPKDVTLSLILDSIQASTSKKTQDETPDEQLPQNKSSVDRKISFQRPNGACFNVNAIRKRKAEHTAEKDVPVEKGKFKPVIGTDGRLKLNIIEDGLQQRLFNETTSPVTRKCISKDKNKTIHTPLTNNVISPVLQVLSDEAINKSLVSFQSSPFNGNDSSNRSVDFDRIHAANASFLSVKETSFDGDQLCPPVRSKSVPSSFGFFHCEQASAQICRNQSTKNVGNPSQLIRDSRKYCTARNHLDGQTRAETDEYGPTPMGKDSNRRPVANKRLLYKMKRFGRTVHPSNPVMSTCHKYPPSVADLMNRSPHFCRSNPLSRCYTNQSTLTNEPDTSSFIYPAGSKSVCPFPYFCAYCKIAYHSQPVFSLHMGLHCVDQPWKCNMCGKLCAGIYEFTAHTLHF